jgi:hypothetical protein
MKTFLRLLISIVFLVAAVGPARAIEKNGLNVVVSKTTIEKNDIRAGDAFSDRIARTQGLKATIKNATFKEMPEGEVVWTILVLRWGTTTVESFSGTEKLKSLKPAESTEMVIGKADMGGYKNYGAAEKDKTEWQVVVKQGGKELVTLQSTTSFDSMAKRAVKGTVPAKASE